MKSVYVVLGLSRSGTSAITRSLAALGVQLGDNLQQADGRNPKGFFEDLDVMYKINRGVSDAYHHEWMPLTMSDADIEQNEILCEYKRAAINLIQDRLKKFQQWGFKDPRTIDILPFWQAVFKAAAVEPCYVIAVRHPLATAKSLQIFAKTDLEFNLALWVRSLFTMLESTQGKKRVIVNYELLLQDPKREVERIHQAFSMERLINQGAINHYEKEFIDRNLRHHEFTDADLTTHPAVMVMPICIKLFSFALQLAKDEILFDSKEYDDAWRAIKKEYLILEPTLNYLLALHKRNVELNRQIRTLKKSIPWKLVYPLRVIDDLLRKRRRVARHGDL